MSRRSAALSVSLALSVPLALLVAIIFAAPITFAAPARADTTDWRVDRIRFEPADGSLVTTNGIGAYRGAMVVTRDGPNLALINDVGLDDYLRGLSEMPRTWPMAALEAQVVAARTFALWNVLAAPPSPWKSVGAQICATDACQVYRGFAAEQGPGSNQWASAVAATTGQILLWHRLVIFAAYGSSDGGQTLSGGVPWLPSVPDPDDATSPLHHWQWTAPLSSLEGPLAIAAPNHLVGLVSGGTQVVATVAAPDGSTTASAFDAGAFYDTVNHRVQVPSGLPEPLPSRRFSVSTNAGQVVIDGGGFGNLLGLSQYGALGKALRGMGASDILASSYGGIRPTAMPASALPATIRVEVASGRHQLTISTPGPTRVLDGTTLLSVVGGGTWSVAADGAGVHVQQVGPAVPAPLASGGSATAPSFQGTATQMSPPTTSGPGTIYFEEEPAPGPVGLAEAPMTGSTRRHVTPATLFGALLLVLCLATVAARFAAHELGRSVAKVRIGPRVDRR